MSSILESLTMPCVWDEYLQYKLDKKHLSKREEKFLLDFISHKKYQDVTNHLLEENYCFEPPIKKSINKSGTTKKRVVYSFNDTEAMVLKVMCYLLYKYDYKISDCCYSFRKNSSAKDAIRKILSNRHLSDMYCLKIDVSNYFNSIPAHKLCEILKDIVDDDILLYSFLERLLTDNRCVENGIVITENRGAMAGTPISPFFANIYLKSLDEYYTNKNIHYFRYSDDILLFLPSMEAVDTEYNFIVNHLKALGLSINPDKVAIKSPHEDVEFLGVCYRDGIVDLSGITCEKLKKKIKRKAHSLYRWRVRRGVDFDKCARTFLRIFNKKFYDETDENSFTWSRWFFPIINTTEGLEELDKYMLQYIRYLYKGRHYKGNYEISYEHIKELGYRSLVNEYYKYKRQRI